MDSVFNEGFQSIAVGWQIWVYWMMALNTASIIFVKKHIPARVILAVWMLNAGSMMITAEYVGFTRILGLVHVVYWTPLAIYLLTEIKKIDQKNLYQKWITVLLVTIIASLILDYIDVLRYILSDRA